MVLTEMLAPFIIKLLSKKLYNMSYFEAGREWRERSIHKYVSIPTPSQTPKEPY